MMFFSPVFFSATSPDPAGPVSFSIKVPGTYGGIQPADPSTGRYFQEARIWSDTLTAGDTITDMKLTDTDGIVSMPERAFLPNYPDVVRFYDVSVTGTEGSGLYLPRAGELLIRPFEADGTSPVRFMPAQLYLTGTLTTTVVSKVFRGNIIWGRAV